MHRTRAVEVVVAASDERDALDPAALHTRGLDDELEIRDLWMCGEPRAGGRQHAALLLRVDHLERMSERGAAFLLHLDDDETTATPEDEVELVAAGAGVGVEEAVAAEPVVAESAALPAIHVAS